MVQVGETFALLRELATGGILVVDGFDDASAEQGASEQVAFRTLVQLDGDVCLSIHARALAGADFIAAFARHSAHVQAVMLAKHTRLRAFTDRLIRRGRAFGFVVGLGSGTWVGEVKLLVLSVSTEVMAVAAASTGALLFGAIVSAGVQAALRSRWLHRDRLRPDDARDDQAGF